MSTSFLRPDTDGAVFGAVHLGYVVVESQRLAEWRRFGADAIGLHVDELMRDVMRFRLDDRECRPATCRWCVVTAGCMERTALPRRTARLGPAVQRAGDARS